MGLFSSFNPITNFQSGISAIKNLFSPAPAPTQQASFLPGYTSTYTPQQTQSFAPLRQTTTGQVLGTSTSSGGGTQPSGGGGQPSGGGGGQTSEQEPSGPSIDLEALNQALGDLGRFETETRGLLGGGEALGASFRAAREAEIAASEGKSTRQVDETQRQGEQRAESAIGEARRGFSELSQNLIGRLGGGGATAGVIGSLGSDVLRTVGTIRTGLQEFAAKLSDQRIQIQEQVANLKGQAEFEANQLIQTSKNNLQQALADIGRQRGALQSQKADLVNQAIQSYRSEIASVRARNAQFQQQLALQQQASDLKIKEGLQRVAQMGSAITTNNLNLPGKTGSVGVADDVSQTGNNLSNTQLLTPEEKARFDSIFGKVN
jgi:hypothetical protein